MYYTLIVNPSISLIFSFFSGLLSFFTPCILPIVPSYLLFISGISLDEISTETLKMERKTFLFHTTFFILGFTALFFLLGYSASFLGNRIAQYNLYLLKIGSLILIFLGLFYLFPSRFPFFNKEKLFLIKKRPESFFGSFLVGCTFFLGWTPCLSPTLSSILFLASLEKSTRGALFLLSYAIGLAVPFLFSALLIHRLIFRLTRFSSLTAKIQKLLGFLLIFMGLYLAFKGSIPAIPL